MFDFHSVSNLLHKYNKLWMESCHSVHNFGSWCRKLFSLGSVPILILNLKFRGFATDAKEYNFIIFLCEINLSVFYRPKSGSMLLYSRKKVRYRRDGYCWKKRKDGKTTREDHMKLKVQGTEVNYTNTKTGHFVESKGEKSGQTGCEKRKIIFVSPRSKTNSALFPFFVSRRR